jgi:spore maturation protein CgeB
VRVLLCHPGASWATQDVHTGLLAGLQAHGHLVQEYALAGRLEASRVTLEYLWRKQVRTGGPLADVRPSAADVQYHAGQELVTRALRFEPDWLVVVCSAYLHPDVLILCRRAGLKLAAVFTESPYDDAEQAKVAPLFHVCFTNERTSVDVLREANPNTHYLPAAYDPEQHGVGDFWDRREGEPFDVVFVGTGFSSRMDFLSGVDWTGIGLRLYGYWDDVPKRHPLAPFLHPGLVDNARTGQLYRRAKIGLNLYRATGGRPAESLNPRAYELAADGVFTLSQPRAEVAEKFGPLVPTFTTPKELETLVRHFLKNEPARRDAAKGLPALVAHDTYHHRAAQLVAHLES